jgi:hypothetical protein
MMKQAPPNRSETCQTARDHIPEVGIPYSHGIENLISHRMEFSGEICL